MIREATHRRYVDFVQRRVDGDTVKEIAAAHGMADRSVEDGFKHLRAKFKAKSMYQLIGILYKKQLIH